MRRDLELLQQYATQDAIRIDGVTIAARCDANLYKAPRLCPA